MPRDTVVLFSKVPTRGKSKTRLIPAFGEEATLNIATSMLGDLLTRLANAQKLKDTRLVMLFSPKQAEDQLKMLVRKFGGVVESRWEFICMRGNEEKGLMSSDLGAQLANGLAEVRNTNDGARSVAFLGMDTPQMPVNELCLSFETMNTAGPNSIKPGFISPSEDGGATLIGVPEGATPAVFEGVRWSATDNCISLMGTFGREGIPVREGGTFTDVDEIEDALTLAKYLNELNNQGQVANPNDGCPRVWAAFMKEGVVFPDGTTKPLSRL